MKQFSYWSFQGSSSVAGDNSLCVCNFTCSVCGVIIFFLISPYFGSSGGLCFVTVAFFLGYLHLYFDTSSNNQNIMS